MDEKQKDVQMHEKLKQLLEMAKRTSALPQRI